MQLLQGNSEDTLWVKLDNCNIHESKARRVRGAAGCSPLLTLQISPVLPVRSWPARWRRTCTSPPWISLATTWSPQLCRYNCAVQASCALVLADACVHLALAAQVLADALNRNAAPELIFLDVRDNPLGLDAMDYLVRACCADTG